MGMDRTFRWDSGRLGRNAQRDFWQISTTVQDPEIPNLPLETPQGGPGFVDLAASLAGVQVVTGALAVSRALAAAMVGVDTVGSALGVLRALAGQIVGSETDTAALGILRSLEAIIAGQEVVVAGLERLVGLAGGAEGTTAAIAAAEILRNLVAEIAGVDESTATVDVARGLSAAAEGAMQITAELIVEGGEVPPGQPRPSPPIRVIIIGGMRRAEEAIVKPVEEPILRIKVPSRMEVEEEEYIVMRG
jgi:hypothetical protein